MLRDMLEEASTSWLENERDRLCGVQRQASQCLSDVKAELLRRAVTPTENETTTELKGTD